MKSELRPNFAAHHEAFQAIEGAFQRLTSAPQSKAVLRRFFQSWSQTNNSAMTVAGISNRLSQIAFLGRPVRHRDALLKSLCSLHRIIDEDLAVTHRVLHSELYYAMATGIVGDDGWLSRQYLSKEAIAFKGWKDTQSLRDDDLMIALLTTLVHEIYTHGEVEYILPRFKHWLEVVLGHSSHDAAKTLGWISVHCGPTEKNHFFHARDTIMHYAEAVGARLESYSLAAIVAAYLQKKAAVMSAIFADPVVTNRPPLPVLAQSA
ncbi:hypothetical protein [Ahniella affigens]|uniref:hypothetical protein n=1 Tax=Ahniella affigens TaxID=2021234 RepID=UPI0011B29460|nr:hypothetical protein [Ahniella affigens]